MSDQKHTRNFAIVAHIDHGKSTLADRLLEATGTIQKRDMMEQILDSNPIERERGITIKLAPVRMKYSYKARSTNIEARNKLEIQNSNSQNSFEFRASDFEFADSEYILNLIDTPGHVDFSYEVSRSLAACEGVLLIVDATQGIQAQTLAHMQLIKDKNLKVIPIINKIDLPTAKVDEVKLQLHETFGFDPDEAIEISAKAGIHIDRVLEAVVERIPPPSGDAHGTPRALVFSSNYDIHRGVVVFVRMIDGSLDMDMFTAAKARTLHGQLRFFATEVPFIPVEMGIFSPRWVSTGRLECGQVGYIATGMKELSLARVGDTVGIASDKFVPLPGYKEPKPMVYLSLFPTDADQFQELRESLEKLHLSDSSFTFQLHSSPALGKGFLCGFLGLLHAEVIRERLDKEFELNVIATAPTVEYEIVRTNGEVAKIHTPEDFPDPSHMQEVREPVMFTTIFTPTDYVGGVMQICQEKRGEYVELEYVGIQAKLTYIIPLSEMIIDFFDRLKSITSGYASLDYELYEYREVDAVKLDIYLNRNLVEAFSSIVVREQAARIGNEMVEKLREVIPRHQFQIPIQAAIGGKIVARADVKSFRKDVTAKLYGGDQTRKDKLLEKQKKGKKKMRNFGNVEIPQEAFLQVYKK